MASVAIASVAIHALVALALVSLPMPSALAPALEMSWLEIEDYAMPEAPAPTPEIAPPAPLPTPAIPEPVREVAHRERPEPTPTPEPEVAAPPPEEVIAPPSVDDVFGEPPQLPESLSPPPPAAVMTGTGSAFAMAPGELGGAPGGVPGGHGTSLVSTVRPATQDVGPSEEDRRRARRGYVHSIEQLVRAHTRYPRAAGREGLQGRVELALRIGNDGRVLAIRVSSTSGHGILDDAAMDAAREIDRVPAPPLVAALTATDEVRVGVVYVVR
jgi:protein TonB